MKINWTVRMKNVLWLCQIAASILAPVLAYYGLSWRDMTSWGALLDIGKQAVQNPVVVSGIVVGIFNAITDPTTKGLTDSEQAMGYTEPK